MFSEISLLSLSFLFFDEAVHITDQHTKGQKEKDCSTYRYSTAVRFRRYAGDTERRREREEREERKRGEQEKRERAKLEWERLEGTEQMEETEERTEKRT